MSNPKQLNLIENSKTPLVSIIIDNYNYGHFLNESINSALNQTYPEIEVIIVDDGSTDNSCDIIKSYQHKIIPIFKENGGQSSCFNAGFAASRGEIICFLDSDDLFLPEKIAEIVDVFLEHEDVGWCCHVSKFFGKNVEDKDNLKKIKSLMSSGVYDLRSTIKEGKIKIPYLGLSTPSICFRRSLLRQVFPIPETTLLKTSDEYIKFTALGLTPGFVLLKELSLQRIHDNNAYTFKIDKNKQKLNAKINIFNAFWMKNNFPSIMTKFSNNLFAIGISLYLLNGGIETECKEIVKSYLASLNVLERAEVSARVFYNYIKYCYIKIKQRI